MSFQVRDDADRRRYELLDGGQVVGFADYRDDGETVVFPHTVIDADRRGQGLGAILVRHALDDMRAKGRTIVPACWYVAEFVDQNPEYRDLVA
jgi:predicted GNAT family acetyltransferase